MVALEGGNHKLKEKLPLCSSEASPTSKKFMASLLCLCDTMKRVFTSSIKKKAKTNQKQKQKKRANFKVCIAPREGGRQSTLPQPFGEHSLAADTAQSRNCQGLPVVWMGKTHNYSPAVHLWGLTVLESFVFTSVTPLTGQKCE